MIMKHKILLSISLAFALFCSDLRQVLIYAWNMDEVEYSSEIERDMIQEEKAQNSITEIDKGIMDERVVGKETEDTRIELEETPEEDEMVEEDIEEAKSFSNKNTEGDLIDDNVQDEVIEKNSEYEVLNGGTLEPNLDRKQDIKAANENFNSAVSISLDNNIINGSITETIDNRLYTFTLEKSGSITLDLTSYMQYCSLYIYGSDGNIIWYDDNNMWNDNLKYYKEIYNIDVTDGIYFLKITGYKNSYSSRFATGNYEIATKFESSGESCKEPNNDFMEASTIGVNGSIKGQIAKNDAYDIYKFSLTKSGRIGLTMTYYMKYNSIYLYNSAGEEIWYDDNNEWNGNLRYKTNRYNLDLTNDTYYLKVTGYKNSYSASFATGNYTFHLKYTDAKVNYKEPNNDFLTAYALKTDSNLKGQIAINDSYDILEFSLKKSMNVKISIVSYMKYYTLVLYNDLGEEIWHTQNNEWNGNVGYRKDTHTITLSDGIYYLKVTGYKYTYGGSFGTGTYSLKVGIKESLANATVTFYGDFEYTGKDIKPAISVKYNDTKLYNGRDYSVSYQNNKKIGKATMIITGKGDFTGTKKVAFKIVPKKEKIIKIKNSAKGTATLKWKRDKMANGYDIYRYMPKAYDYRKVKSISKNSITSYKNTNLKKGKFYYYIVRSYKIVKGKKYYGIYSDPKYVKIKK